jgi:hypothetical protein
MYTFKAILIATLSFITSLGLSQNEDNQLVKDKLLKELDQERKEFQQDLEGKILEIDQKIFNLDSAIKTTASTSLKIDKLIERVQILEKKQNALERKTFNTYKYNYSSAIINLASMEREIKPLDLFNSSRDFFSTLETVSNPMHYPGYKEWFETYKAYIEKNKEKEAKLMALDHLLNIAGDLTQGSPFTGPLTSSLFEGMSLFINSIKKKDKELADKSIKMFELTATVSQFTHDKNLIETEWESINKSLEELRTLQSKAILENIVTILGEKKDEFDRKFTNETDAIKRFEYIKLLTSKVETLIQEDKRTNPEKWKEKYYRQMMIVQSLKIRFGSITFRILENIDKYDLLISKYKHDKYIGSNVSNLEIKLHNLKKIFESTFNPQEYINAANEMYVVE